MLKLSGTARIIKGGFNDRVSYSLVINKKIDDDKFESNYFETIFKCKEPDFKGKKYADIDIVSASILPVSYSKKDGTLVNSIKIIINEVV